MYISNTQDSVSSAILKPWILPRILRCASYGQLLPCRHSAIMDTASDAGVSFFTLHLIRVEFRFNIDFVFFCLSLPCKY